MIAFQSISLQRGHKILFDHADLSLHHGQRLGLTGANGAGKSSLFQLLTGELQADGGELLLPGQLRIAHMAQQVAGSKQTALDYVTDGDQELRQLQHQLALAEQQGNDAALAELHAAIDAIDGYNSHYRAEQLLHGLGFKQDEMHKPVAHFSGGWRIRLNLAQALMCRSDLLLLDEPTNHLDLDAIIWLEQFLQRYSGTLMLISHDRDFLDNVVNYIAHVEQQKIHLYKGNYSAFERQRAERLAQQQAQYEKQQRRVSEIRQFVDRFRAKATKARQAQSRLKELERMEKIAPAHVDSPFKFRFLSPGAQSDPLITLTDAELGYKDSLLHRVNLSLHPGSRIGLLGPNGAGKSTLIKSLAGELALLSGIRSTGDKLVIGYFAQHQLEALDSNASPLLHLQRISPDATEQALRDYLGSFNFHGDMALGSIENFSGGEKARLALAIVTWKRPNLLLLDEPTNHLDLEMRHALTYALQLFDGAMVLVSHDRHLLKNNADQLLLVAEGRVQDFNGDLQAYQDWLIQHNRNKDQSQTNSNDELIQLKPATDKKAQRQQAAALREQLRPLKKSIQVTEKSMETLQQQMAEIEQQLADPDIYSPANKSLLQTLLKDQGELNAQLHTLEEDWFMLCQQLESLETSLGSDS